MYFTLTLLSSVEADGITQCTANYSCTDMITTTQTLFLVYVTAWVTNCRMIGAVQYVYKIVINDFCV